MAMLNRERSVNVTVVDPKGNILLAGHTRISPNFSQVDYDGPADLKIILERVDTQTQLHAPSAWDSSMGRTGLVVFDEEAVMPSDLEIIVSNRLAGMVRRKKISEAAYQQEKNRRFAELYGGGASVISLRSGERNKWYGGSLVEWRERVSIWAGFAAFNGASTEVTERGFQRRSAYFDLGDEW